MISLASAIVSASLIASPLGVRAITLEYSTYLGGSSVDSGLGIAVNNAQAFVVGTTYSSDFPTADPYQAVLPSIDWDVFLSAFSSSGSSLIFSTYLGGSGNDAGYAIGLDNGEAIIAGSTYSADFPTRVPYQSSLSVPPDVFVSRLSSSGSQLVFSTFLGGGGADEGYGIAVDNGQAYVAGWTRSTNFPLRAAYQTSYAGGEYDSFVSKLSSDGSQLAFSTYLGGKGTDNANGIAVENGSAFVTGWTQSTDFPVLNPFQASSASPAYYDVFVSKLSTSGSQLLYSTYLGGTDYDYGYGIAVENGSAFITGYTRSSNFPRQNPYQTTLTNEEVFVSRLSSGGSRLLYSTFLGGSEYDSGEAIAVVNGEAVVTGYTISPDFPIRFPFQASLASPGQPDAFVSKLSSSGSRLLASTYLGGSQDDAAYAVAAAGEAAYITGDTTSSDFPTRNPFQWNNRGDYDAIVSKLLLPPPPAGDSTVHTDFNGDGTSDIAIFRPSTGLWSVLAVTRAYAGVSGDDVVPSDYNGDGTTDIAIFRSGSSLWSVRGVSRWYFGSTGDIPVPGDYDGDRTAEAAVFRPSAGLWSIRNLTRWYLGALGDDAVPGDYNGAGKRTPAVFRPPAGLWVARSVSRFYYGATGDDSVPGDYDGAGRWKAAVYRPSGGFWAIRDLTRIYFGSSSDYARPADFNGDGNDEAGIFRDTAGLWAVQGLTRIYFGISGDIPVTR